MRGQDLNRISGKVVLVLSVLALLTVLAGFTQPLQADEGALAHIFQLLIVALMPTILVFLATADWRQPLPSVRPLAIPAVILAAAFAALYVLEHVR